RDDFTHSRRMPDVLDWRGTDSHEAIGRARAFLQAGRLVAFPSELGYECAASALHADAVSALKALADATAPLAVGLRHVLEVFDWLPFFRGAAARFARRFWPGPLV